MRIVAENPAPFPRYHGVTVALSDAMRQEVLPIDGAQRLETELPDASGPPEEVPEAFAQSPPLAFMLNDAPVNFQLIEATQEPWIRLHFRGRAPTSSAVVDLWATLVRGSSIVQIDILLVNSDPTTNAIYEHIRNATLIGLHGVKPFLWWASWRGAKPIDTELGSGYVLLEDQWIADTQGQAWSGFLALAADEAGAPWQFGPVIAMGAEWDGQWGPFGPPPAFATSEAAYVAEIRDWWIKMHTVNGHPWLRADLGLEPNANATGGQHDFGASKLGPAFKPGLGPLHALHAAQAALQECCRPGDFREADGRPVAPWEHTNHVTWSHYTHWHRSVSSDRLGKDGQPHPLMSGGWVGKDREHWSSLNLCGAFLLTGNPVLLHRIEVETRLFLSGETIDPRLSTSNMGAPRGVGRTFLSAAWIDCCLAVGKSSPELLEKFRARVFDRMQIVDRQRQKGFPVSPLGTVNHATIPNEELVSPWQEAQGIIGLRAAQLRFPAIADLCQSILLDVCRTFIEHGWWKDSTGWHLADYHAWNGGQPLEPGAYPGPRAVRREGFEEWSWGAVMIAHAILNSARSRELLAEVPVPRKVVEAEWIAVR